MVVAMLILAGVGNHYTRNFISIEIIFKEPILGSFFVKIKNPEKINFRGYSQEQMEPYKRID
jgi:hypothetical protein